MLLLSAGVCAVTVRHAMSDALTLLQSSSVSAVIVHAVIVHAAEYAIAAL